MKDRESPFDPKKAHKFTEYYWNLPPAKRSWEEVARHFGMDKEMAALGKKGEAGNKAKAIINRMARMARALEEKGDVVHLVLPDPGKDPAPLPRNHELEKELLKKYPLLRYTAVVNTEKVHLKDITKLNKEELEEELKKEDDRVHEVLGRTAARLLKACMRGRNEVIGVASGRGPYYAILYSQFRDRFGLPEKIISLTGRTGANLWSGKVPERSVDADDNASMLGNMLGSETVKRVRNLITAESRKEIELLGEVTFGLMGVGSLALHSGHRFRHYKDFEDLRPIWKDLKQLIDTVDALDSMRDHKDDGECCVGDVCNRLFVVRNEKAQGKEAKLQNDLTDIVVKLNNSFVTPTEKEISAICERGMCMAVCGGKYKLSAIRYVLEQKPMLISHLIIDADLASKLTGYASASSII